MYFLSEVDTISDLQMRKLRSESLREKTDDWTGSDFKQSSFSLLSLYVS
uniref:Alternative protein ZBTB8A n=1 Tax=Homo sapiens TaxID=9606 RepID=L8EC71_HUMAN|nr:alternative protein ZBTB8A [Homo sapiens]